MSPGGKHKPVIGLVGGVGSGKSLVASQFASLGCAVIDADELARGALDESAVAEQLVDWWGPQVRGCDGRIDRQAVSDIVFNDAGELAKLEKLVHPLVRVASQRLRAEYEAAEAIVAIVEDCPLLLEAGLDEGCDAVIFVAAERDSRVRRVAQARGWTAADLARREKNQLPLDTKAAKADYVVDNNATEADTKSHVRRVLSQILQPGH